MFEQVPPGYWDDIANQRKFCDWFASQKDIKSSEDWHKIKVSDIKQYGGSSIMQQYGNSLIKMLETVYPEQTWQSWNFDSGNNLFYSLLIVVSRGFWIDVANHRKLFDSIGTQLGVTTYEDWYKVKWSDLQETPTWRLVKHHYGSSYSVALSTMYPL
jgi:hypothetical protein